jgi:hypothetical protein
MYACVGTPKDVRWGYRQRRRWAGTGRAAYLCGLLERHERLGLPPVRLATVLVTNLLGLRHNIAR